MAIVGGISVITLVKQLTRSTKYTVKLVCKVYRVQEATFVHTKSVPYNYKSFLFASGGLHG